MTNDEQIGEIEDLLALEQYLSGRLFVVRRSRDMLKRKRLEEVPSDRMITNHALIRYMERHKGIDVEAMRNELRAIAAEAERTKKNGEHHWHQETGIILIIGDAGQVITVLSPEQAEKHLGRKLANGERIGEKETQE